MTAPAATVTSLELMPTYGQSENRPTASDLAATLDAATSGQVFYTFGLATESGTTVGPDGAGLVALDQARQAAGFMVANGLGRVSPAYTMQHARAATWRQEGQTARGVLIADHGFGGQAIERWNPADASPIGRNQLHWMRETARLAADANILATCPYVWLFQGTSAKNQEGPAYRAAFEAAHAAVTAEAARLFGAAPRLMVVVNGADVNTIGDGYDTPGVQYRLAVDNDGIIGTWQRLFPIRDRNIHLGPESQILVGETCAWAASEVESGAAWNITYSVAKSGRTVTVDFALRPGETLMERAGLYADYGGAATCAYFGFEAQGGIVDAVADLQGNRVTLTLATPEAGWFRLAHQVQDCSDMTDANGMTMSAHRSTLFGSHTRPSRFLPGQTLWRPVPGFRGRFVGDQFLPEG